MNEEDNKTKSQPEINPVVKIEQIKNYSEKIGDILIKGEKQYAKPFINEVIPQVTPPKTPTVPPSTDTPEK